MSALDVIADVLSHLGGGVLVGLGFGILATSCYAIVTEREHDFTRAFQAAALLIIAGTMLWG